MCTLTGGGDRCRQTASAIAAIIELLLVSRHTIALIAFKLFDERQSNKDVAERRLLVLTLYFYFAKKTYWIKDTRTLESPWHLNSESVIFKLQKDTMQIRNQRRLWPLERKCHAPNTPPYSRIHSILFIQQNMVSK